MGHFIHLWAAIDIKLLLLLFAAIWALYKVVQRGELHPLLDLKVSGRLICIDKREYLLCSLEVKNVHVPVVRVEYSGLLVSEQIAARSEQIAARNDKPSLLVVWKPVKIFPAFKGQNKIWSGETIRDRILFIAPSDQGVFKLEFRIARKYVWYQYAYKWFTGRNSWSAVTIVKRDPQPERGAK